MRTPGFEDYREKRIAHWDKVAEKMKAWQSWGRFYGERLAEIHRFLIPPGQTVLELGCGVGDLLASVDPKIGVGVDFSPRTLELAKQKYPALEFVQADAHELDLGDRTFDYIILSEVVNDLWDVKVVLERLSKYSHSGTRLILNYYSRVWEIPLSLTRWLGLAKRNLQQNWLTIEDLNNLLYLSGFEAVRNWREILFPLPVPLVRQFFNKFLVKLWPFNLFALTNFTLARPLPRQMKQEPGVSVVVPARNEAGNIEEIFRRVPQMGKGTELIFVEGNSKDNTLEAIQDAISNHPEMDARLYQQPGIGKADAVQEGFKHASGDILMILDADITVPPENLVDFYNALVSHKGEFINGVRLVYPMEKEAMQFLNLLGNKFFSLAFSWLLGQPVKDTLCGTKVLWKKDYEMIAANRDYFGDFDPFGDFDLIFGAAKLGLKIVDLPIRYRERTYGETNIDRWRHGWLLIKMVTVAARRLKFV
jgi:SAM-dependent methyltransferase